MNWDSLLEVIRSEGAVATKKAVLALTDAERRALAPRVSALARASSRWWDEDNEFYKVYERSRRGDLTAATAVATAGILPASKLPGVLRRIEMDTSSGAAQSTVVGWVLEMLESRDLADSPKLAAELADASETTMFSAGVGSSSWRSDWPAGIPRSHRSIPLSCASGCGRRTGFARTCGRIQGGPPWSCRCSMFAAPARCWTRTACETRWSN